MPHCIVQSPGSCRTPAPGTYDSHPARASRYLRDADQGDITAQHQLFDDMIDRDAHLACEFGKRVNSLLGIEWSIEPPTDASASEKSAAGWANDILKNASDNIEEMIEALMDGVGHGFSGVELEWKRIGSEWLPAFHPRPQTWFQLPLRGPADGNSNPSVSHRPPQGQGQELLLKNGTGQGEPLIPFGWIMHQHKLAKTGYLGRSGICRVLIWPFIYKHYAAGDFAEFLDTYGLPIILGKYGQGATPADKSALMRAVKALGHDARGIMPQEMQIEIEKVTTSGDGDSHLKFIDWAERSQSKCILGQTLSAESHSTGLGSGLAQLHAEVRDDIMESDARRIADTLTRDLIYPLLTLNGKGGDTLRRCPRWVFDTSRAEDIKTYSEALPRLVSAGFRIPVAWAQEKLCIPLPDSDEEEILTVASPGNSFGMPEMAAMKAGFPNPKPDALSEDVNRLSQEAAPAIEEWLARVEVMLESADSLEEFRAMLLSAYPNLDTRELAGIVATALTASHLAGRSDA